MRLKKIKIRKYEGGGFASAAGIGMEMPSPVQEIEHIDKDKAGRLKNVAEWTAKGAGAGAALGSFVPGVGNAVGAVGGALVGAAVGVFGNKKAEKARKKANAENEALNEQMKQENIKKWTGYGNAENAYNIQRATDLGYDATGNTDAQFYGKSGGRLSKKYAFANGGLSRKEDFGSDKKPYPSVDSGDFAGGNRSYPIPTKADAVDALRLAGLHGRSDVRSKVFAKYPELGKNKYPDGGKIIGGFKLSPKEVEALNEFKDNPAAYKQALFEITGFEEKPGAGNKPGSQTYQDYVKGKEAAIKKNQDTYSDARYNAPAKTKAEAQARAAQNAIDNKTNITQKTEKFLSTAPTEVSEDIINKNAAKSVAEGGGTYEGITVDPYANQSYEYEKYGEVKPTFKTGGNVYLKGGRLDQLSNDTSKAIGNKHKDGGIQLTPNAEIEGGETVTDKGDHLFIASANLKNPATGNTFAKDDATISKKIGKFEGRSDKASQNAVKMLETKKANLEAIQQSMNGDHTGTSMKKGGRLSKIMAVDGATLYDPTFGLPNRGAYKTMEEQFGVANTTPQTNYTGEPAFKTSIPSKLEPVSAGKTTSPYSTSTGAKDLADAEATGFTGGAKFKEAVEGMDAGKVIGSVANTVANYGVPLLEYASQKKAIKRLEALNIPDPILQSYKNLGRENMDADRANVNRDVAAANVATERGLSDSTTSAAVRAANISKGLEAKAAVNQTERNVNRQITNQETQMNQQIESGNQSLRNAKQQAEFQKKADIIGMKSEAFSKLMENIRTGQSTQRQEKHVNTQFGIDAYRLDDKQRANLNEYMKRNNYSIWGKNPSFKKGGRLSKMC